MSGIVYLVHFDRPIGNANHQSQHYIGYARKSLKRRIAEHKANRGARILQVVNALGIPWSVVKTWSPGSLKLEKQLKLQKHAWRHCPICRQVRKENLLCLEKCRVK
jgi:predicted GIY-YIG superfamily endonuclease